MIFFKFQTIYKNILDILIFPNFVYQIVQILEEKEIEKIIIGLPLSMSGKYSKQTKKVISFKELLIQNVLA